MNEAQPRVHGLNREPFDYHYDRETGKYKAQCNAGECPRDALAERIYPGHPNWASHPDEVSPALFLYNKSYVHRDARASYFSEKYPWLRMAARYPQPFNLHSDWDLIAVAINQLHLQPDDGQHFLVHW